MTELCSEPAKNLSRFHVLLVRNLIIMRWATSEGTTCSLMVITTDKKQVDVQRYVITVMGIPSLTTGKMILNTGISALMGKNPVYI
jgi:hypothetical protein